MNESTSTAVIAPARRAVWRYVGGLAPVVLLWIALAGWLAWLLLERGRWSDDADRATIREWIDETRMFRQTLPELVRDYVRLKSDDPRRDIKRQEIEEHMRAMSEPTRMFANQLPSFPEIYLLSVQLPEESIQWASTMPRPRYEEKTRIRRLEFAPFAELPDVRIMCDYRMHAFNRLQRQEEDRQQASLVVGALLITSTVLAGLLVWRFLNREHAREVDRLSALAAKEHRERDLLAAKLAQEESEKAAQELHRRAIEAEKSALEIKSQIYASIGIMAGSYAHNIKNLLVRPNDLLARCLEVNGLSKQQEGMLAEVKDTLGTVTERLQQILRTVRRDPQQTRAESLDLNALVRETVSAWKDTARDKWKLHITADIADGSLPIVGDASHLQQAIENLLFNARDATFEMRNHLRDEARRDGLNPDERRKELIKAAAWWGEVLLRTRNTSGGPVLEVRDNGIGMTADVLARCRETHFSTKRENALYEGYSAGMGLGLSFVAMVLDQHGATLEIESDPLNGACFRILWRKDA